MNYVNNNKNLKIMCDSAQKTVKILTADFMIMRLIPFENKNTRQTSNNIYIAWQYA